MFSHAPADYVCPFCALARSEAVPGLESSESRVFYRDGRILAFISSRTWPGSEGNCLIVPYAHHENVHDLPDDLLADISVLSKRIAGLYKSLFDVAGVTIRQHNEPAGGQDVWHYHLHVMPRTEGMNLYLLHGSKREQDAAIAVEYAARLREALRT